MITPADVYDARFVPALFGPWGPRMCAAADVRPGQRVLDVACGTGALTRAVRARVGPDGHVVGLDVSTEMLAVARRHPVDVRWVAGRAEALPFPDGSFDRVVSQFGFMFFDNPVGALRELHRVLAPGGRMVVAVCDAVDHSPGYAVLTALLHRLFGAAVADAFRAPFALGDRRRLLDLARAADLDGARVNRVEGDVRFRSIADLVATERACAWTLGGLLDDHQFARLTEEAEEALAPFARRDGTVRFTMPALLLAADELTGPTLP